MDRSSSLQENLKQRGEERNSKVLGSDKRQTAEPEGPADSHATPSPDLIVENVSDDFEIVSPDDIPNQNSEELTSMINEPSFVGAVTGCIQQLTGECISGILQMPLTMEVPNLGVMRYVGTFFNCNALPFLDDNDEEIDMALNELWSELPLFSDELRLRQCYEKTLLSNCTEIIQTLLTNDVFIGLLTFLERRRCINKLDNSYLKSKSDPSASTRILFSMITQRDLKTLFTFTWTLKYFNESLYQKIIQQINADNSNKSDSSPLLCLRCILIDRVEAYLLADHLITRCNNLRKWYRKVINVGRSETERFLEELFDDVKFLQINTEVREAILEAIEDCGFYSDILKMLQEDKQLDRNSFECRCSENHATIADVRGTCRESSRQSELLNSDNVTPHQSHTEEIYQRSAAPATCAHFSKGPNKISTCERREDRSGLPFTCTENNHSHTYEKNQRASGCVTRPHNSGDVQNKNVTSESLTDSQGSHNTGLNDQMNSNSLKRKNSEVGDEDAEGSRRKKSSLLDKNSTSQTVTNSSNHSNVSDKKTKTFHSCSSNSDRSSGNKECKRGSDAEDISDNLKMDELKEAVDIQPDSGVTPGQSLNSFKSESSEADSDSGYYDKNTRDKDETVPKVLAVEMKARPPQQTVKAPLQSDQTEEGSVAPDSSLEVIDADHPEDVDLNVNQNALLDALDESCDESAPGSIQDVNNSGGANSEQRASNTRNEPFINIQVKKKR